MMFRRQSDRLSTRLLGGAVAGAVDATALNTVTYGDMLLRSHASSDVLAKVAGHLAGQLGITSLQPGHDNASAQHSVSEGWSGASVGAHGGVRDADPHTGRDAE